VFVLAVLLLLEFAIWRVVSRLVSKGQQHALRIAGIAVLVGILMIVAAFQTSGARTLALAFYGSVLAWLAGPIGVCLLSRRWITRTPR
jgi:hypothetical protein